MSLDLENRIKNWDILREKYLARIKKLEKPIKVKLPDGKEFDGTAFSTTPLQVIEQISKGLAQNSIVATVNNQKWDMTRPLEEDCTLKVFKWESEEAKNVFWHSSSHVFGEALEKVYGLLLCKGPALEEGFFYEGFMNDQTISQNDFKKIQNTVQKIVKEKQPFERIEVSKEDALEMFKYNKFKHSILQKKVPEGSYCTVYRCGTLVDPCTGPHLPHTGKIKAVHVWKNSSSYWDNNKDNESLQRLYGITFPDKKKLKEWVKIQEELEQYHHKTIGLKQNLWFMHEYAPGMFMFLPKGQHIFNKLLELMRKELRRRKYTEVQTANMFHNDLWKKSGHWQKYQDDMFILEVDKTEHALKPMNCPGHCLLYSHKNRSYKDLPVRYCEFGVLHRNELRGALGGLTRVRRFQQDDGHIFCTYDQIGQEMDNTMDFMKTIYSIFNFKFNLYLSTRPEKYLGDIEVWNKAESMLEASLKKHDLSYEKDIGGGAFYGPKIDIYIRDTYNREHQCATIQLDFNLPERFNLTYSAKDGSIKRPAMIHRAIFGSLERFMAILTEHVKGKWPFWMSPRQICVVPVTPKFLDYAKKVEDTIFEEGFDCVIDDSKKRMDKKIRTAQVSQFNFILVVGANEAEKETVNIRLRDINEPIGEVSVKDLLKIFKELKSKYTMNNEDVLKIIAPYKQKEAKKE